MWTVELTVGDHEQNGFVHLARWQFPDEASARAFIAEENAAIPDGAEPDHKTEPFTFILDLHEGWRCENMVDNSRNLPMQSAMRLAPNQVRNWLDERPEPDSVVRLGTLLPVPARACAPQWGVP
ncbi:MAG: hypothetical protein LC750_00620 [Actinobacteria bacterium]|nr:hypothetical protein [Actinomycetota bacterium]